VFGNYLFGEFKSAFSLLFYAKSAFSSLLWKEHLPPSFLLPRVRTTDPLTHLLIMTPHILLPCHLPNIPKGKGYWGRIVTTVEDVFYRGGKRECGCGMGYIPNSHYIETLDMKN
jgi:hypothetical protein